MATNTLNVRMKQAVRTEAEWTSDNPVLLEGEVAYSSDKNNMYKVGDGTKTWSQLAYNSYPTASTSSDGLMSSSDKTKLNNIASGAEVNQNAFSNVTIGSTTIAADTKTDTLTLIAGSNITLTPDATNDKITITATDTTYESKAAASGGTDVSLVTTGEKYTWNSKTSNTGTITGVSANGTSVATSGVANIPAASTSVYGVTKLSDATNSTSTDLAATANAVKKAYDHGGVTSVNGSTGAVTITVPTKVSDLTNDSGFISSVPIASSSTLGGIKVGDGLSIAADGTLSSTGGGGTNIGITYDPTNEIIYITTGGVANGDEVSY